MSPVVNGHRNAVQYDGVPVPLFGSVYDALGEMMRASSSRGEGVRLPVELLGYDVDATFINANVAKVTSDLFDPEEARLRGNAARHGGPQLVIRALGRKRVPIEQGLETIHHSFVVHEDVDRALSYRD